jgi:hypothetical protein
MATAVALSFPSFQEQNIRDNLCSHLGGYEKLNLLGCDAVCFGRNLLTFRRNILPPSSGSKSSRVTSRERVKNVAIEMFTVITVESITYWDITPYNLLYVYGRFGDNFWLTFQGRKVL